MTLIIPNVRSANSITMAKQPNSILTKGYEYMKKLFARCILMMFGVICALSLASCSIDNSSTNFREVNLDIYFANEELPQSTKDYVRNWIDNLPNEENRVYALCFKNPSVEDDKYKDYYYLIYIPGCGSVSSNSYGLSGKTLKLKLNESGSEESFYYMSVWGKTEAPELRVTLDGKYMENVVTIVDFRFI